MSPNPVPVSGAGVFLEHPAQGVEESAEEEKMSNWSHGYNVESGYTFGFYREMSPVWLDYVARHKGVRPLLRFASDRGAQTRERVCRRAGKRVVHVTPGMPVVIPSLASAMPSYGAGKNRQLGYHPIRAIVH